MNQKLKYVKQQLKDLVVQEVINKARGLPIDDIHKDMKIVKRYLKYIQR
jgi:hypothetical protein